MEKLQKFIKEYFSLLNVRNMPEAVFASYKKYIADNDFPNKDVENWSKKLMNPGTTDWKDLPDFNTLSDDELNLLYVGLLNAFEEMSIHKSKLSKEIQDFIDEYYGNNKVFNVKPITPVTRQQMSDLINLVLNDSDVVAMNLLGWGDDRILRAVQNGQKDITDKDVKKVIFDIIKSIRQTKMQGYLTPEAENKLSVLDLNAIQNAVKDFDIDDVIPQNRDDLKANGAKIFETLFKKNKIYDAFKKYEPGEKFISEQIDVAFSDTDYTGKINEKNYIAPKYKEDLTWRQKLDKKLEDTYSDVLKKYLTLHRANLFIKPEAKAIFGALDKAKLKSTDGLDKVLEKSGDIANALKGKQPFSAAGHFEWMSKKLTEYQKNGMGKTIQTALRHGRQMKHIIEQLVVDAVKEGKAKEAKTAMEVLSVMQYGMFNSRTMDAINKTDFNIFSDSKLSWNKNEGMQFVTKAADRTMKAGLQLGGYAATAIWNKTARRVGAKFNHSGELNKKSNDRKTKLANDKAAFDADKLAKDTADNTEIINQTNRRNGTGITDVNAEKLNLQNGRTDENNKKAFWDSKSDAFNQLDKIEQDYANNQNLEAQRTRIQNEISVLENLLQSVPGVAPTAYGAMAIDTKKQELTQKQSELQEIENQINQINAKYIGAGLTLNSEYSRIHTVAPGATADVYTLAKNERDTAELDYNTQKTNNDDLANRINEYEDATEIINTTTNQKNKRQDAADHWDENNKNEYLELMGYWDFLQSGNTKSLFHWSTKKLQKKMDKGKMNTMYNQWMQQHNYAA